MADSSTAAGRRAVKLNAELLRNPLLTFAKIFDSRKGFRCDSGQIAREREVVRKRVNRSRILDARRPSQGGSNPRVRWPSCVIMGKTDTHLNKPCLVRLNRPVLGSHV